MKTWYDLSWAERTAIEEGKVDPDKYYKGDYNFQVKRKVEDGHLYRRQVECGLIKPLRSPIKEEKQMIERYEHHGRDVAVISELKGTHRTHCLCFGGCLKFKPNALENCPIAQATYEHDVKHGITTPVYECPEYDGGSSTSPSLPTTSVSSTPVKE